MGELVLVLCAAVVNTAVKLWTGDNAFAGELSEGLTDLIKSRVSSVLDQRKILRQFSQMEELVADQILAAMSGEFRDLDEGERNAAIAAVTETISRAQLTDKVLFAGNLDPLYLEKFFRRFVADATRDLSSGGEQLFDRVLARCCADIIEIADKLPRFQVGVFTELLRRDSQILRRLEEVLERLPAPSGDNSVVGRVDAAYRQRIAKVFDRLDLFGLDFAPQWYALSIAYVNLTVSVQQTLARELGSAGYQTETFEHWLGRCPRLLIDGRAGGGKTTILQWIAVRAACRDFTGPAAGLNGLIPFYIRLREYASGDLPQPEQFLDKVAPLLAPEAGSWPRKQLLAGRAIVLIDGIDEVPLTLRRDVLQWLRDLIDFFPESRYVVTTRPGVIEDKTLADADFTYSVLEPMSPALVDTFIDQWHTAMGEWESDTQAAEQLMHYRDELHRTIDNDRFLSELASTPLLAGLICALNQHLAGQLPRRRGEVFERALGMFYERDRKRGIEANVRLDLSATKHLLGELALWMVRNTMIEVAEETARGVLARAASSLPGHSFEEEELYRYLLLRSGLLREPTAGFVDFVHRSFQEYLAAQALVATDNVGEIVRNAADDQWREVVILASGQGNWRQTTDLLRGLMLPTYRGSQGYQRRLLAVASLEEIRGADPETLDEVMRCIPDLVPPRSPGQAEALSHAGEQLLPHLMKRVRTRPLAKAGPTIRAASLIGGPQALDLIEAIARMVQTIDNRTHRHLTKIDYATHRKTIRMDDVNRRDFGGGLIDEFVRGWDYFRDSKYPERVLLPIGVKHFRVDALWKLVDLAGLPGIHSVRLDGFVVDGLDLRALGAVDVGELVIYGSPVSTLSGLIQPWSAVKRVELVYLPNLTDVTALRQLPNLRSLIIKGCGGGANHLAVAKTMNLEAFRIETAEVDAQF